MTNQNYHPGHRIPLERSAPYDLYVALGGSNNLNCEYDLGDFSIVTADQAMHRIQASDHLTMVNNRFPPDNTETLAVFTIRNRNEVGLDSNTGLPIKPMPHRYVPLGPLGVVYTGEADAMRKTLDSVLDQYQAPGQIQDILAQAREKLEGEAGSTVCIAEELPNSEETKKELTKVLKLFLENYK